MNKLILLTGAHRSGTTWAGRMISQAPGVSYVHEPFNISIPREYIPLEYWFEYVSEKSECSYQSEIEKYIKSFYELSINTELKKISKISNLRKGYSFLANLKDKITSDKVLIKDPIAIMSAEWFYKVVHCNMVITIRHPAAFVASLKVKGWEFDFNNYLDQKELMKNHLIDFEDEIIKYSKEKQTIVNQGILLWNTIYSTVKKYKNVYADYWHFIRHEDLSKDPINEFKSLFYNLNLDFTPKVKREIIKSTTTGTSQGLKRNSKKNIYTWKERLSLPEIKLIKEKTYPLWNEFYSEDEW